MSSTRRCPRALPLVALAVCAACGDGAPGNRYGPAELDESALSPVEVHGQVLAEEGLAQPTALALWADTLGVLDNASDSVVHLYRAADGGRIRTFGRHGAGPGEYRVAWSFVPSPSGAPWIYDVGLGRVTPVSAPAPGTMLTFKEGGKPTSAAWVGDSALVASGFFTEGRLAYFDTAGHVRRGVGEVPGTATAAPVIVRQEAFISTLLRRPRQGDIALATRHADRIELYREDGTLLRHVKGPFSFEPVFTVARGRRGPAMASDESMRFGYIGGAASRAAIYALFSGRTREGFHGDAVFGRYVHVYDWNGELQKVLRLDADVIAVAVDPADRVLYALRHDPTPAVLAYAIPR
jgi:hypothetical protein